MTEEKQAFVVLHNYWQNTGLSYLTLTYCSYSMVQVKLGQEFRHKERLQQILRYWLIYYV